MAEVPAAWKACLAAVGLDVKPGDVSGGGTSSDGPAAAVADDDVLDAHLSSSRLPGVPLVIAIVVMCPVPEGGE